MVLVKKKKVKKSKELNEVMESATAPKVKNKKMKDVPMRNVVPMVVETTQGAAHRRVSGSMYEFMEQLLMANPFLPTDVIIQKVIEVYPNSKFNENMCRVYRYNIAKRSKLNLPSLRSLQLMGITTEAAAERMQKQKAGMLDKIREDAAKNNSQRAKIVKEIKMKKVMAKKRAKHGE